MIQLKRSLQTWGTPAFERVLKEEVGLLDAALLPLQAGLSQGGCVSDSGFQVILLGATEGGHYLQVRIGVFYSSVIAGCSCADDPTPVDELTEYCELRLDVDRATGETTVTLLQEV